MANRSSQNPPAQPMFNSLTLRKLFPDDLALARHLSTLSDAGIKALVDEDSTSACALEQIHGMATALAHGGEELSAEDAQYIAWGISGIAGDALDRERLRLEAEQVANGRAARRAQA